MNRSALHLQPMDDPASALDERRRYELVLENAMAHAERLLPRDEAFEVAHDVALEMLERPVGQVSGALIYVVVTSRLRDRRRSAARRAVRDGTFLSQREGLRPSWMQPGAELEANELRARIEHTVAGMPPTMREVFRLVREQELSYTEAATRLGVALGTVHTHLSRANALLRDCVARYRAEPDPSRSHAPDRGR